MKSDTESIPGILLLETQSIFINRTSLNMFVGIWVCFSLVNDVELMPNKRFTLMPNKRFNFFQGCPWKKGEREMITSALHACVLFDMLSHVHYFVCRFVLKTGTDLNL